MKIKADQVIGITETGSNENGEWIKYEDGTMIQYMYKNLVSGIGAMAIGRWK